MIYFHKMRVIVKKGRLQGTMIEVNKTISGLFFEEAFSIRVLYESISFSF